jgi:hypothetical protein
VPIALAGLFVLGIALRVWGVARGLPWVYNVDEAGHFVPTAIGFFGHSMNPGYFMNPPGFTYLLWIVFGIAYGGGHGVGHAFATDPTSVYVLARVTSAVTGMIAVGLVYLAGARLFDDRRVGLLAAAVLTVAFLPVHYGHLALNDASTLTFVALGLWGSALVARRGRLGHYALAGVGFGLAAAFKYTGGVVVLALLGAVLVQLQGADPARRRAALRGLGLALGSALVAFLAANPYALGDPSAFWHGVASQQSATGDVGKLGTSPGGGVLYYLWTATWGLGWVPALAAVGGSVLAIARRRRAALLLVPAPLFFLFFMGLQSRYFGRWLMPAFPFLCLLAGFLGVWGMDLARRHGRRIGLAAAGVVTVALVAQGLFFSVHGDRVMARPDTRNELHAWMVSHIPVNARIEVEPFVTRSFFTHPGHPAPTPSGSRWRKLSMGAITPPEVARRYGVSPGDRVLREDYERILRPATVRTYLHRDVCWVIIGSMVYGRALADPARVPEALPYYRALARAGTVVARFSPYHAGSGPVPFNFDWSFDYYPLAYEHPGPAITVYRLHDGRCRTP